jgi:hypothetical protein
MAKDKPPTSAPPAAEPAPVAPVSDTPAPAPAPAPELDVAGLIDRRFASLRAEFTATFDAFGRRLDELEKIVLALPPGEMLEGLMRLRDDVLDVKRNFRRMALAMDRPEFVHPPATAEAVAIALKSGHKLKVLREYKTIGLHLHAGRTIEHNQVNKDAIISAVARGLLQVSVLRPDDED